MTDTGRHFFGDLDLFWDHDKDHLDPDHIPIWWQLRVGSDGEISRFSSKVQLDWTADISTRVNTASSIERQIEVLPALIGRLDAEPLLASLKVGVGYWFLEIDDDAPKERGYVRDDLRNTTLAESLAAAVAVNLGASSKLIGQSQAWWDSGESLHTRYAGELHVSVDRWIRCGEIVINAEVNEYNLDIYRNAGAMPILPWDHDLLISMFFVTAW